MKSLKAHNFQWHGDFSCQIYLNNNTYLNANEVGNAEDSYFGHLPHLLLINHHLQFDCQISGFSVDIILD